MTQLPAIHAKTMQKVLLKLGFRAVRQKGSHVFYRHPDGRSATVPHHAGRDLILPVVRQILREIKLSPEEFQRELRR